MSLRGLSEDIYAQDYSYPSPKPPHWDCRGGCSRNSCRPGLTCISTQSVYPLRRRRVLRSSRVTAPKPDTQRSTDVDFACSRNAWRSSNAQATIGLCVYEFSERTSPSPERATAAQSSFFSLLDIPVIRIRHGQPEALSHVTPKWLWTTACSRASSEQQPRTVRQCQRKSPYWRHGLAVSFTARVTITSPCGRLCLSRASLCSDYAQPLLPELESA